MPWLELLLVILTVVILMIAWAWVTWQLRQHRRILGGMVETMGHLTDYLEHREIPTSLSMDDAQALQEVEG